MKVLDLDMDYFMTDAAHTNIYSSCRLPEEDYGCEVWPARPNGSECGGKTVFEIGRSYHPEIRIPYSRA